jgi:hypothetical protein
VEGCHVTEPIASVNEAFSALGRVDLKVVLSAEHIDEDRKLSSGVSDLDFIVNGADRRELGSPDSLPGGGLELAVGSRGKKVGVLTANLDGIGHLWRDQGELGALATRRDQNQQHLQETQTRINQSTDPKEGERLKVRLTYYQKEIATLDQQIAERSAAKSSRTASNRFAELGTDVADHPATAARVTVAKDAITALAPTIPTRFAPSGPFVGSAACVVCHAAEASHWSSTAHANAYASLVAQNRQKDQACFGCHITGMFHPDGPKSPGAVAGLENVGCEACHGPGREHAAAPTQVKMSPTVEPIVCTTCHDSKQDGGRFDLETYLPKIKHPISSLNPDHTLKQDPKLKPELPPDSAHHFVVLPDGAPAPGPDGAPPPEVPVDVPVDVPHHHGWH